MSVLLDLVYFLAAIVASPWIVYRLVARGDWRGLAARFGAGLGAPLEGSIWLHGSSAGEIALLVPLVRLLEESEIDRPLVISAYSSTGLAAARRAFPGRRIVVFPFDISFVVARVVRRLDPRLIVIVESEYWPNFLRTAHRRQIPVAVINGKISERSRRLYARTRLIPALLRNLSLLAVQAPVHEQRMRSLGVSPGRIRVTGNMKYDLAHAAGDGDRACALRERLGYRAGDVVVIGGSVHDGEDAALLDAYRRLRDGHPEACLVLVPRYPADARRVEQIAASAGFTSARKTSVDAGRVSPPGGKGILIVDTVGELRGLYAIADVAFVGGSLFYRGSNKGGHNLMEPAILGVPVVFGPHHYSFQDTARELVEAGGGFEVGGTKALVEVLRRLVEDESERRASGRRAAAVIRAGQGATRRNFELLLPWADAAGPRLQATGLSPTMPRALSDVD